MKSDYLQQGFRQRDFKAGAAAGFIPIYQCDHYLQSTQKRCRVRGDGDCREQGLAGISDINVRTCFPVPVLLQTSIPGRGAHHHSLPTRHGGPGIIGGESRQGTVDKARVGGTHRVWPKTQPAHDARTEILHHDIGPRNQVLRPTPVAVIVKVKRDPALSAVKEGIGLSREPRPTRRVDVHHLGTILSKQFCEQGARNEVAEVHDLDSV
ncbi:hypothetical protein StoSoilA2_18850 [Arthrobacter sp. StoSoilA2]|nr:hypothetical protein StoSoilA2_18850 [Arthrobacter sp. StoSoilA2]